MFRIKVNMVQAFQEHGSNTQKENTCKNLTSEKKWSFPKHQIVLRTHLNFWSKQCKSWSSIDLQAPAEVRYLNPPKHTYTTCQEVFGCARDQSDGIRRHSLCGVSRNLDSYKVDKSGQIIATSYDLTPKCNWERDIPLFQGNLGWWNILIWPDKWRLCILRLQTQQRELVESALYSPRD